MSIALIPARSGSKRIPNKNSKLIDGKPLIEITISKALRSGLFKGVYVSTDSAEIAGHAIKLGAEVPGLRPKEMSGDSSPDIAWIEYTIENWLQGESPGTELILLRPTNPFRRNNTIRAGLEKFRNIENIDSLRAIRPVNEHPGKMWKMTENEIITPFISQLGRKIPTHSSPTQTLERLFVQSAALEIFTIDTVLKTGSIAGNKVVGFEMSAIENFDLNTFDDWKYFEFLLQSNPKLIED